MEQPLDKDYSKETTALFRLDEFHPLFAGFVKKNELDWTHLAVAFRIGTTNKKILMEDRHQIWIEDKEKKALWVAPAIGQLFRGDRAAPPDIRHYPPGYVEIFYLIERHLLSICDAMGDVEDDAFVEIYSTMRRIPDTKSMGHIHDIVWQCAAVALAMRPLSQAEFEAVLGQLSWSIRWWRTSYTSCRYISYLRTSLESQIRGQKAA